MIEPAAVVLARWVAGLGAGDLPGAVAGAAREHLIDAVGCAVAGLRRGTAGPALAVARGLGGPPESRLFGGERLGAVAAGFGNAVAVHALDFDDTHPGGLVHASAVTVPAMLAVGEECGSRGSELIVALVAGLEVVCRLGVAAPHGFHARGLHATSMCGPVAAAVTAGKLLGLDVPAMTNAIGIAASGASGLLEFLHSPASTKQLHPGTAVANGILAARLARAGATGPAGALDGPYGLFHALAAREPDREAMLGDLGRRWETTRIAIKAYPCCQLAHASIDAARALSAAPVPTSSATASGGISKMSADAGGDRAPLTVTLHPDAVPIIAGVEKRRPRSAYEAKFSVYWCVAAAIVDGWVGLESFEDLDRPEVLDLAARIQVRTGPSGPVAAAAPGVLEVADRRFAAEARSGRDVLRAKAAANLGTGAGAVFAAVDAGADAAALLDAIEGCLS
ncbi:MmgE/PrpD family protein [Actinoplanes sp. NPDC051851]|uniref:MmgE/PrpD family protein n=1 Tax=Actinoplanes sp. NPDC051851 TaxID=3154753 RepID=UPI00342FB0F5